MARYRFIHMDSAPPRSRVEKTQITVRYGTINRVFYKNNEMIFSVSPSESENADFTISSKNWNIFELEQDMYDYLHTVLGAEPETPITEETQNDG